MAKKKFTARTYKRRLLKLAALLEADAKNKKGIKFNISVVGTISHDQSLDDKDEVKLDCGTTVCAMGLASLSGAFKHAGLSYKITGNSIWNTINGETMDYDRAAVHIFGIPREIADVLFSPNYYSMNLSKGAEGELEVARRIRLYVAEGEII
jgi:hypothetical protein